MTSLTEISHKPISSYSLSPVLATLRAREIVEHCWVFASWGTGRLPRLNCLSKIAHLIPGLVTIVLGWWQPAPPTGRRTACQNDRHPCTSRRSQRTEPLLTPAATCSMSVRNCASVWPATVLFQHCVHHDATVNVVVGFERFAIEGMPESAPLAGDQLLDDLEALSEETVSPRREWPVGGR